MQKVPGHKLEVGHFLTKAHSKCISKMRSIAEFRWKLEGSLGLHHRRLPYDVVIAVQMQFLLKTSRNAKHKNYLNL